MINMLLSPSTASFATTLIAIACIHSTATAFQTPSTLSQTPSSSYCVSSSFANTVHQPILFGISSIRNTPIITKSKGNSKLNMARYGPKEDMPRGDLKEDFFKDQDKWEASDAKRVESQSVQFDEMLENVIDVISNNGDNTSEENELIPAKLASTVTQYLDVLLNMRGYEGVDLFQKAIQIAEESGDEERLEKVSDASEYIISFMEEFVEQATEMEHGYKLLLGKIIKAMTPGGGFAGKEKEERFDEIIKAESENVTPGFLHHVENECKRVTNAPVMSPESAKLLQTLQLIQTRVVEELGKDLGEGALVLGQLIGYDDKEERVAVLEAGLTVRGMDFAKELSELTQEALIGFGNVPEEGGVDPELVERVEDIDKRVNDYIGVNC